MPSQDGCGKRSFSMVRLTALLFVQIFLGSREHQLDTVQLIYLAGTGVIVNATMFARGY